ncbi:sulfurtransferase [Limnochorda pilosa]|uniref:3-mercaptopyruvate sulfurtransferase n=1 Tax=Limnochorda pilosa TaxID=1555112 RepID=A0A0K2SHH3_LIMPI|nr:sulfurtransferase [Limnochorda pilosa]BAS26487.1 3-mercaptopyruvate sulfurtransferase [Limnochorda pilosa]
MTSEHGWPPEGGFGPLVDAARLRAHLLDDDLVLFDCRFTLGEPDAGRKQYLAGHVPSALFLDLERDLAAPVGRHGGRHPLPNPQTLAEKLGRCGVDERSTVVVYDDGSGSMAPHAWWLLGYLGLERVAVLDGGFPAWIDAGGALSGGTTDEEAAASRPPRRFTPHPRREWIRTIEDVRRVVEQRPTGVMLVDSRAPERYRGEEEPLDPSAGHIPGAVNLYWAESVGPDGRWKRPEDLAHRFRSLKGAREVVVYCGSGVTACANLLAMRLAGLRNTRLYPGSWSDWCSYPELPVATGALHEGS